MLHSLVRRPLFSAVAALSVLGAAGAVSLANDAVPPATQHAAHQAPARLDPEQSGAAQAQAEADAADRAAQRMLVERGEAAELAARQAAEKAAAEAAALAAQEAARAAEQARAAEAERQREAAAEQASRDARRDPRGAARLLVAERGWGAEQFDCLDSLWTKESGWNHTADNPTSSAFGIPQALPGSKMASFGADWETNPVTQIKWGLHYIEGSYGTPCSAWAHSRANDWY